MKPLGSHTTTERTNRKQRINVLTAMKRVRLCLAGNWRVRQRSRGSRRHAARDEGAKVAEGSRENECPEREAIEIGLHPNNRNKEDVFSLNKPWKRLLSSLKIVGSLHYMTADLGSSKGHAGPCTLSLSGHKIRPLTNLHPDFRASFRYLCSIIPHRMPATHSLDLSPVYVGSLTNTPLHFSLSFF
jgi:hypothetical protein